MKITFTTFWIPSRATLILFANPPKSLSLCYKIGTAKQKKWNGGEKSPPRRRNRQTNRQTAKMCCAINRKESVSQPAVKKSPEMQLCVFIKINDSVRAQNRTEKKKNNATNCDDLIRRFSLPHTHANKYIHWNCFTHQTDAKNSTFKKNLSQAAVVIVICRVAVDV